jgi:ABC-2 type transport system permease protein
VAEPRLAPFGPMLAAQTRAQLLHLLRSPFYSIFCLVLPLIFWVFFGLPRAHHTIAGVDAGAYLLASFGTYAVANVMLFAFGIGIANERGRREDVLMRATPLRPGVDLTARLLAAMAFGLTAVVVLSVFALATGGVRLDTSRWLMLVVWLLIGSLPLLTLGLAIGYLVSVNAVPAVVNLVGLPMFLASGLVVPVAELPDFIQKIAPYLPAYRYAQLAWDAVGAHADPPAADLAWLAAYTAVFLAIVLRAYRLEESRKFR